LQPPRALAKSLTGATSPTVAVPGLARADDRTIVDDVNESAGTGVATVTDLRTPRRTRIFGALSAAGAVGLLGLVLIVRGGGAPKEVASTSAPSAAEPAPSDTASAAAAPAAIDSTAPEPPAPPAPRAAPGDAPTTRRAGAAPARKRPDCLPPYTIDARSVRHYKPECL
jgi:hypothetical protein